MICTGIMRSTCRCKTGVYVEDPSLNYLLRIEPLMIDVVVGFLVGRKRTRRDAKHTANVADSVMGQEAQEADEEEDGNEDGEQGEDEDGADRVEESNQEHEANGANQDGRGTSSYQIGGRELLQ